jgi:hypothetical protein
MKRDGEEIRLHRPVRQTVVPAVALPTGTSGPTCDRGGLASRKDVYDSHRKTTRFPVPAPQESAARRLDCLREEARRDARRAGRGSVSGRLGEARLGLRAVRGAGVVRAARRVRRQQLPRRGSRAARRPDGAAAKDRLVVAHGNAGTGVAEAPAGGLPELLPGLRPACSPTRPGWPCAR